MNDDDEHKGFAHMPRWLQRSTTVTAAAKLTYLALSSRADKYGASWPSHRSLAAECSCSISTIRRALLELRDLGVIDWDARARPGDGGRSSNRYRLTNPVDNSGETGTP